MSFTEVDVIVFDYGNTLIEFGPRQLKQQAQALEQRISEWFGPVDGERLRAFRGSQITKPYRNDFIENRFDEVMVELAKEVCGVELSDEQLAILLEERHQAFHASIAAEPEVRPLLEELRDSYRLGFISNYPCGESIRSSLQRTGLHDLFESIVVSGEVGRIKPHPLIFETLLEEMQVTPERCVYIGDNWLADVQGAKRMGMKAIHLQQHEAYESFERQEGDHEPDAVIHHLEQLRDLLGREGQTA